MYQALYRKYRPKDFDSVVGQDHIVKTLKNSIKNHTFSHAYMFFGSRGIGKTTVSKIFARNVNCLNSKDGLACGKCSNCKNSFSNECVDIIEIDAASNNGVDDIRNLKSKVSLVPAELTYKVYIIDEVHMLSIEAFNALLKTLEEPPSHAIFILATTDPQKVPETIISRCQCFSFQRISPEIIVNKLVEICKNEKIKIDSDVLYNIAVFSEGGLRDSIGLLDKLISYNPNNITMDDFTEINGIISEGMIKEFSNYVFSGDVKNVLLSISDFENDGKNLVQIYIQLLNYLRKIIVDYFLSNTLLDYSIDLLQKFLFVLNENMFDIKNSDNSRVFFEMIVLKFISDNSLFKNTVSNISKGVNDSTAVIIESNDGDNAIEDVVLGKEEPDDILVDESKMKSLTDLNSNIRKVVNLADIMKVRVNNTLAMANKKLLIEEKDKFKELQDYSFDQKIGYIVCSLLDSNLRAVSENEMIISFNLKSTVDQNLVILSSIEDVYNKITNSNKKIAIVSDDDWEKIKSEYISNLKNNVSYKIEEEPDEIFENLNNDDIITSSAINLFGDIVEVE
ncbi:MAG: DNA polymerase III subunit gamma/tau [Bacilli bacterium]|nr:DNA polymerase III subunit gamma/tau [Bacilli bacterium]MBR1936705.1 DNA polymerase III subunit gamma/tau [Bacilli bacterium]